MSQTVSIVSPHCCYFSLESLSSAVVQLFHMFHILGLYCVLNVFTSISLTGTILHYRDVDELSELSEQRSVGSSEPWSDSDGEGEGQYPSPHTAASRELSMLAGESADTAFRTVSSTDFMDVYALITCFYFEQY